MLRVLATLPFLVALALVPTASSAKRTTQTFGVAAGEITPNSAVLWTRFARPGTGKLIVATDIRFKRLVRTKPVKARASGDNTISVKVSGLKPKSRYVYRFFEGRRPGPEGFFQTAPEPNDPTTVEFALTGDADAQPGKDEDGKDLPKPFYNAFQIYARMAAEGNDFNVNMGDTIYSDSEVSADVEGRIFKAQRPARSVREKWAKYRMNLAQVNLTALRGSAGLYSHWDDHEFIDDFSIPEHGRKLYAAGVKAFTDYTPVSYTPADGLYRSFRWGRQLELFFLDERSFRSAKADDACINPQSGTPDLLPTGTDALRAEFGVVVFSVRKPVAQSCRDAIADPGRTLLGARQLERFMREVAGSTATFKVVMNEVPIQQAYALPYDRWEGYAAERREVLQFLREKVKNVVFLTTDTHATLAGDARLQTFEEGGPLDSGILEVVTGPAATMTLYKEVGKLTGILNVGDLLTKLFFKDALKMRCAQIDAYSYAQVSVTGARLTITPKGIDGKPLRDFGGGPCGPFALDAK